GAGGPQCAPHESVCRRSAAASSGLPRPPSLTLFPYTTLFRSCAEPPAQRLHLARRRSLPARSRPPSDLALECGLPDDLLCRLAGDRKSTRLNSSHVKISYAVFCWKKKRAP